MKGELTKVFICIKRGAGNYEKNYENSYADSSSEISNLSILNKQFSEEFPEYQNNSQTLKAVSTLYDTGIITSGKVTNASTSATIDGVDNYTILCYGIKNDICVKNNGENGVTLEIKQNNIKDTITITKDNDFYMDGEKIVTSDNETTSTNIYNKVTNEIVVNSADNTHYWTSKCPYGKSADYTYRKSSYKKPIVLSKKIKLYTVTEFIAFVVRNDPAAWLPGAVLGDFYSEMLDAEPETKGICAKVNLYTHKNYHSGYISPRRLSVYENCYIWYSELGYSGVKAHSKWYECT